MSVLIIWSQNPQNQISHAILYLAGTVLVISIKEMTFSVSFFVLHEVAADIQASVVDKCQ